MVDPDTSLDALLPHRGASRYLSRVLSWEGTRLRAACDFVPEQFPGHFPGRVVVPGVVHLECMAQALACLAALSGEAGAPWLTGVDRARFRGAARPPCTVEVEVEVTDRRLGVTWARGVVLLEGREIATARLQAVLSPEEPPPAPEELAPAPEEPS